MLRQPGVELLAEIVALVRERPDITTGALLEHFADREEAAALQKLATQSLPGEESVWREEFLDTMAQLEKQTRQQRVDELNGRIRESGLASLTPAEKDELRELQAHAPA
jgi:DNA primase